MEIDILSKNDSEKLVFSEWMEAMNKFYEDSGKELEQIRKDKAEIQQIREELYNRFRVGRFIHDDERIVISAPEIIIGNVDKYGQLKADDKSSVVIRGANVSIEGVGEGGTVQTKATKIAQLAVDPGYDGVEDVVHDNASITSLARSISIDSNKAKKVYTRQAKAIDSGIYIHSDSNLMVDASLSNKEFNKGIDDKCRNIDTEIRELESNIKKSHKTLDIVVSSMKDMLDEKNASDKEYEEKSGIAKFFANGIYDNTNASALHDLYKKVSSLSVAFFSNVDSYLNDVSQLAEKKRQKEELNAQKTGKSDSDFKKLTTDARLVLNGETVEVSTKDGEGKIHTDATSKISINAKDIDVTSTKNDLSNIKKGNINIHAHNINIDSNNCKVDKDKGKTEYVAEGKVTVNSEHIDLFGYNYKKEGENGEKQIDELSKDSVIKMNTSSFYLIGKDKDYNAINKVYILGKEIEIGSITKKENEKKHELIEDGKVSIVGNDITIGSEKKHLHGKSVVVAAQFVNTVGEETYLDRVEEGKKERMVALYKGGLELQSKEKIRLRCKDVLLQDDSNNGTLTLPNIDVNFIHADSIEATECVKAKVIDPNDKKYV